MESIESTELQIKRQKGQLPEIEMSVSCRIIESSARFLSSLQSLPLSSRTLKSAFSHHYNSLEYAWDPWNLYVQRYMQAKGKVLFVGMNPGPWGMAQTGIPFGDVRQVKEFLGIIGKVGKPQIEHPKREILGFACPKSEVSGTRLWSFMKRFFHSAQNMANHVIVYNYCPISFMQGSGGSNVPLNKLNAKENADLLDLCDLQLAQIVEILEPSIIVCVGKFTWARCLKIFNDCPKKPGIAMVYHPSPANPKGKLWENASCFNELLSPQSEIRDIDSIINKFLST